MELIGGLNCLDDRMVIGPGFFKAVRQEFDGWFSVWRPDQKADCRSTEPTDQPKNIFHCYVPS
jgi:hypothetical protein